MHVFINYAKQKRMIEETVVAALQIPPLSYGVNLKLDPCGSPQSFNLTIQGIPVLSISCMKDFYGQIYGYKFSGIYDGVQILKRDLEKYAIECEETQIYKTIYYSDFLDKFKTEVLNDDEET